MNSGRSMSLADEIRALQARVLTDLNSAHDYFTDTKTAWRLVRELIAAGHLMNTRNTATGTVTTEAVLAAKSRRYVAEHLVEATFQQFISIFENFYFELLHLWLTAFPGSLGRKTVDFKSILEQPDKDAITRLVVRKEINEVLYARPTEWFSYLEEKAKLGCPSAREIERIAEVKASRDVLVHNKGIANPTYESKAGALARFRDGDKLDVPEDYHRETWELIRKLVTDISDAAIAKVA
jgi:hypothetical protein